MKIRAAENHRDTSPEPRAIHPLLVAIWKWCQDTGLDFWIEMIAIYAALAAFMGLVYLLGWLDRV